MQKEEKGERCELAFLVQYQVCYYIVCPIKIGQW